MTTSQTSLTTGDNPITNANQLLRARAFMRRVLALLHEGAITPDRARQELGRAPDLMQHLQEEYLEHCIEAALRSDFCARTYFL